MPKIPIDDLPEPPKNTLTRNGYVYVAENTVPVIVTIRPGGVFVECRNDGEVLGLELKDISNRLTLNDVELLKAGKVVKL